MVSTQKMTRGLSSLTAGAVLSVGLFGAIASPSFASETPETPQQQSVQTDVADFQDNIKQVDESHLAFRLADGDTLAADGSSIIGHDGTTQALPSEATDAHGDPVNLAYAEQDGVVTISVVKKSDQDSTNGIQTRALSDGWKCALGTTGGAGTGAIAGGAAGATIGSVFPGVGTAAGWVVGTAIGGAVSGGAVGAAASC